MGLEVSSPDIYISPEAQVKLDFYIAIAPQEVSGIGTVDQLGKEAFLIDDIFLFKQESSAAETEFDSSSYAAGVIELMEKGIAPEKMRVWWHSHVNMSTTFSGTDHDTMSKNPSFTDVPYFISIVGNKSGSYNVRFDMHDPVRFYIDGMSLNLWADESCKAVDCKNEAVVDDKGEAEKYCDEHSKLYEKLRTEFTDKVTRPTFVSSSAFKGKEYLNKGYISGPGSWAKDTKPYKQDKIHDPYSDYVSYDDYYLSESVYYDDDKEFCDASGCYKMIDPKGNEIYCVAHGGIPSAAKQYEWYCLVSNCYEKIEDSDDMPISTVDDLTMTFCGTHMVVLDTLVLKYGEEVIKEDVVVLSELIEYIEDQKAIEDDPTSDYINHSSLIAEMRGAKLEDSESNFVLDEKGVAIAEIVEEGVEVIVSN